MPVPAPDTVLICSWLEPEHVARLRRDHPDLEILHAPELLRPPRYPADHKGADRARTADEEARWLALLARATILFDFDQTHLDDLPERAPQVRWIQATSAGIGQFVRRVRYAERMPQTVFTTARGVHAVPLAEFALLGMLLHARRALHMVAAQGQRHWERFAGTDLEDRTVVVLGLGAVGGEVARLARAHRMRVIGVRRHADRGHPDVHRMVGPDALAEVLPEAEFLVLIAPHTDETEVMIGAAELAALPAGAALINIGRGALVDEPALVDALTRGHLGGAYLDVFADEPLPPSSPLWSMPNVLVSPHSGSTSDRENERITELFSENLRRWKAGEPLLNRLDPERLY
ncbi:MAG: D-2-hydroxyacid dehydrogenase [Gemmatimonadota bacterium]|nr:D-2-hydroxyacid dehydrogenase [Gemmatimonadota bacterium]